MMNQLGKMSAAALVVGIAVAAISAPVSAGNGGGKVTRANGPSFTYGAPNPFAGADVRVHGVQTGSGRTIVTLKVQGLDPKLAGTTFGAHVHVARCGSEPSAAGGHFMHGTATGSLEDREIWLDFTVNRGGNATARAERPWVFDSSAKSVVIHAEPTNAAGGAGSRLACTTAEFR